MKNKKYNAKKLIMTTIVVAILLAMFLGLPEKAYAIDAYGRALGIDVSVHNGTVNWESVKNSGMDFAIIRIGFGDDLAKYDDSQAERNMSLCESLGIPYGVYIYSYATSEGEVQSEVDHTVRMIQGHNPSLGIWFDMEDADNYKYNHAFNPIQHGKELTAFCLQFIREMKSKGYSSVGVYANKNYFTTILDYNAISAEGMIWLAHWGISEPSLGCQMWQYSSEGKIPGAGNYVDMNYIYPSSSLMSRILRSIPEEDFDISVPAEDGVGDIDFDGNVSASDCRLIKRHIMGIEAIEDEEAFAVADMDEDGAITAIDYVAVKNLIINLSGSGDIYPSTTSISIPVGGSATFNVVGENAAGYFTYSTSGPIALTVKDGRDSFLDDNKRTFIVNGDSVGNASVSFNVVDAATYNGKPIETSFTVNISVYQPQNNPGAGTGGGDEEFAAPAQGSDDTSLKKLEIEGFTLQDEGNDTYSCTVGKATKKVKIIAEANDENAKVKGDGEVELQEGLNELDLIVEAENGFSRSYRLNIIREGNTKKIKPDDSPNEGKTKKAPVIDSTPVSILEIVLSGAGVIVFVVLIILFMILAENSKQRKRSKEQKDEELSEESIEEIEDLVFVETEDGTDKE